MSGTSSGTPQDDFPGFLRFAGGLWTLLAGASALFPLANVFVQVIPVSEKFQPLFRISPAVMAPTAVLTSAFTLLVIFGRRQAYTRPGARRRIRRAALLSFVGGVASLAAFLYGEALLADGLYGNTGHTTTAKEAAIVAGDLVFIALYCGFFVLMTRAFTILALVEYDQGSGGAAGAPPERPDR